MHFSIRSESKLSHFLLIIFNLPSLEIEDPNILLLIESIYAWKILTLNKNTSLLLLSSKNNLIIIFILSYRFESFMIKFRTEKEYLSLLWIIDVHPPCLLIFLINLQYINRESLRPLNLLWVFSFISYMACLTVFIILVKKYYFNNIFSPNDLFLSFKYFRIVSNLLYLKSSHLVKTF